MKIISKCEVCGHSRLDPVLDLGSHPLCDDLIPVGENRTCKEYPIEILFCESCLTAHQKYQVPKHELFTKSYHYRASVTGSVLAGMAELVASCASRLGDLKGRTVLDIGCNDGSLLNFFAERGCRTIGVEPTGAAADSRHPTINAFFDAETAAKVLAQVGKPDIITFTNVFAHIEDLPGLLSNLRTLMGPKTTLVVENHYLGAIVDYGQFDTFYHEHPRTYSFTSFQHIARTLGLNVSDVQFVSRYGGNIRVYINSAAPTEVKIDERYFPGMFDLMRADLAAWRKDARARIEDLVGSHGPLRAKAFPGRAAILVKLLGLDHTQIAAVYEIKNSIKVGHYVPGTRIPILPEAELFRDLDQGKPILNLAWHIPAEVRSNLKSHGYAGEILDIKEFRSLRK